MGQRMEFQVFRAPTQKIRTAALQLARTRAGENKNQLLFLDASLDIIEKDGDTLDLIDNDQSLRRQCGNFFPKKTGRLPHCRSEEHTSEHQSRQYLVCRLLLEKKKRGPGAFRIQSPALRRCASRSYTCVS